MSLDVAIFDPNKGTPAHQRNHGDVPVCVITSLNIDEVLFSNITTTEDDKNLWVVAGATVYIQRFWTTSTATITLTTNLRGISEKPPELPLYKANGPEHRLQPEDEIRIFMGYIESIRPIRKEDYAPSLPKNAKLRQVFLGAIDTLTATGTATGTTMMIQCRDRMRYMMDTIANMSSLTNEPSSINKALGPVEKDKVKRSKLILNIAQIGIGYVDTPSVKCNVNGKQILPGRIQDLQDFSGSNAQALAESKSFLPPDFFYVGRAREGDGVAAGTLAPSYINSIWAKPEISLNPIFNMMVGRLGFETEKLTKNFQIDNQIPVEFIKFISNQEPYPAELFMNHLDGDFYYTPRKNYYLGLFDPRAFNRLYYYRNVPEELEKSGSRPVALPEDDFLQIPTIGKGEVGRDTVKPEFYTPGNDKAKSAFSSVDYNQMALSFKEEVSTIAMKTNFIVLNFNPSESNSAPMVAIHMAARPAFLRGLSIAGRNMYVIDETISNPTEAAAVASALARIHAKEVKAAALSVLGDPTFAPGEIVQVLGSPLRPETLDIDLAIKERELLVKYEERDNANYIDTLEKIRKATASKDGDSAAEDQNGNYNNDPAQPIQKAETPSDNYKLGVNPIKKEGLSNSFAVVCAVTKPDTATIVENSANPNPAIDPNEVQGPPVPADFNRPAGPQQNLPVPAVPGGSNAAAAPPPPPAVPNSSQSQNPNSPPEPVAPPVGGTGREPWRLSGFAQEPVTLWRVEGVRHQFNRGGQQGYTTELALLSVFS